MIIKTKEFRLTEKEYFKISLVNTSKKMFLTIILFLLLLTSWAAKLFFIALFPLYISIYYWFYSQSKKNKIFFKKHTIEINDNFLTAYFEDESLDKINLNNIIKVVKRKKYYLLYIAIAKYIYLPVAGFYSEQDMNNFETLLKIKKLLK